MYFIAATPKTTFLKVLRQTIGELFEDDDDFDPFGAYLLHEPSVKSFHQDLHGVQCVSSGPGRVFTGAAAFGMTEARWVIEGSILLAGFNFPESRKEYAELVAMPAVSTTTAINTMARAPPNFIVVLKPGDLFVMPAGYVVFEYTPVETTFLRWGLRAATEHELNRTRQMVSSMVDAQPRLRTTKYFPWLEFLRPSVT